MIVCCVYLYLRTKFKCWNKDLCVLTHYGAVDDDATNNNVVGGWWYSKFICKSTVYFTRVFNKCGGTSNSSSGGGVGIVLFCYLMGINQNERIQREFSISLSDSLQINNNTKAKRMIIQICSVDCFLFVLLLIWGRFIEVYRLLGSCAHNWIGGLNYFGIYGF